MNCFCSESVVYHTADPRLFVLITFSYWQAKYRQVPLMLWEVFVLGVSTSVMLSSSIKSGKLSSVLFSHETPANFSCVHISKVSVTVRRGGRFGFTVSEFFAHRPWLSRQKSAWANCRLLKYSVPTWTHDWREGGRGGGSDSFMRRCKNAAADLGTDTVQIFFYPLDARPYFLAKAAQYSLRQAASASVSFQLSVLYPFKRPILTHLCHFFH